MTAHNCKSRKGHFLLKDRKMDFMLKNYIFTPFNSLKFIQVYLPYLHTTATINGRDIFYDLYCSLSLSQLETMFQCQ